MQTPFDILDVSETATDEEIKSAYLKKVKQYTPEQAPEQFQGIRKAFEKIQTHRQRLSYHLFENDPPDINRLLAQELQVQAYQPQRPPEEILMQALANSLSRAKGN
jgi:curved DNA-binding protein CbpA